MLLEPFQTTLADGVPLEDVTFVAVDLETTGGSPVDAAITEIGAVLLRGGERLATFQTLVNPARRIPPSIVHLTGIDDRMVADAPPIDAVLPSFLEFARGATFVAHNATFDFSFLNASLARSDRPALPGPPVCTAKLARRVVWPDVPNVRLATLARYFRTRAEPCHRALADAEACGEVLHGLLDLGARLGIATLGDLYVACSARGRPNFGKIAMAEGLPAGAGVYRFRARDGRVLYVGKSTQVKTRVKSYFYGDERKQIQDMLEEVASVDAVPTPGGELEALVVEARQITGHEPRYNRRGKRWRSYAYLKLDPSEAWPRVKVARTAAADDGCAYLGPFPNSARARLAKEAFEEAFPIRRCTRAMGAKTRFAPCALADMGRCVAPCDGRTTDAAYRDVVGALLAAFTDPSALLRTLEERMKALAAKDRFEEAALARDRLRAVAEALWRHRVEAWLTAGTLHVRAPTGSLLTLRRGALTTALDASTPPALAPPCPRERADELAAVRSWVCRHTPRVEGCDVAPSEPIAGGGDLARILRSIREAERAERDRSG
ncbi:MAG: DEDD exonuclease domain-containing protein [Actinomycetota bacterium]